MDRYMPADMSLWDGRVDSTDNFEAFRWHQWMQRLNLEEPAGLIEEGTLGIAFLGFCCDEGVRRNQGRIGAAKGPNAIRKELANLPCAFSRDVKLFDAGNVLCVDGDLEKSQAVLACMVSQLKLAGLFPILLGGGHEMALGHYRGLLGNEVERDWPDIGIINIDAHFDLRHFDDGGTSGTPFRQIATELKSKGMPFKYMCIGVQDYSNTRELFKTADALGVGYLLADEITNENDWHVIEKIDGFLKSTKNVYLTLCADVFASAYAPGVSAIQPLGLNPEQVNKMIKYILRSGKVSGFDIAEILPRFDQDRTTASLAKVLIFSVVVTLCQMKGLGR